MELGSVSYEILLLRFAAIIRISQALANFFSR